ncbi:MAG: hypothetical protein ACK6DE_15725, partial [Pseudanabaena sp.]
LKDQINFHKPSQVKFLKVYLYKPKPKKMSWGGGGGPPKKEFFFVKKTNLLGVGGVRPPTHLLRFWFVQINFQKLYLGRFVKVYLVF